MSTYRAGILVRFAHCDPAGMVFYPRYLEMFNNLVEDWCRELNLPFREIQAGSDWGLPTVHLEADFAAPSYMGEILSAALQVRKLGTSSITVEIVFQGPDGLERVRGRVVLVLMDMSSKRALAIPEELRERLLAFVSE